MRSSHIGTGLFGGAALARTPISNGDPGGGLYNQGTTYLYRVMVTNNLGSAGNLGGDPGSGGGIASVDSLYIYDSTIANNRTREGSNTVSLVGKSGGAGGGIFATGLLLEMFNSTVSGNETGRGGDDTGSGTGGNGGSGGGLYSSAVTTRLDHCTFGLNVTGDGGSGFIAGNGGFGGGAYLVNAASATHTIFSQNTIGTNAFAAAVRGTINPASYVMVDDLTLATLTGTGNTNASALLEPLGDNGGPTLTHALASGSPALDGGDPAFVFSGLRDQRGALREPNAVIDIGAVEMTDDFDGDTIPDDWEKANGMNAEDSGDATIDIDLDTFTSFEEYIANTDPFDFYDQLEMLAIFTNVGPIAVRYDSKLGRSYLFDQSFDGGKTWINFGTFPGAGGVQTIGVPDSGTSMIRVRAFIP